MKTRKGTLSVLVILMATLLISCGYAKSATESDFPPELPGKDPLQKMIELVVEANPILQTQRNFIKEIGEVPGPVKGPDIDLGVKAGAEYVSIGGRERSVAPIGKIELTIPFYSSAKKREIALDNLTLREKLTKAWQDYYSFKNSLISDLLGRADEIIILENELEGQKKLLSLLQYNLEALRKQVEAGVTMPSSLWNMSERIITSETNIVNLLSNLNTLKRETAVNLAGDRWQELLKMLDEIAS